MRLIDADKVIIPFEEYCARMAIQNAPTVDAVPVERKKPIKEPFHAPFGTELTKEFCPNCKEIVYNWYKFCHECGQGLDWEEN